MLLRGEFVCQTCKNAYSGLALLSTQDACKEEYMKSGETQELESKCVVCGALNHFKVKYIKED